MISIAIMGYGTVGKGCADVLKDNGKKINIGIHNELRLAKILDLREFPGDENEGIITHDFNEILSDDGISIVIEAMGGKGAAYKFTKSLLEAGKSVVTSNKELVSTYGDELLAIAREKGCHYMFEASVGGGIPVISPIAKDLAANEITEILGIVNGTSNYILTAMQNGASFAEALRDAQAKGYAEADPTADIEGIDACRKIIILGAMAFGYVADASAVYTKGISQITLNDINKAQSENCTVKLIARAAREENGKISLSVRPYKVKNTNMLANVSDVFNGIIVRGNEVNSVMFYGPGAGSRPTASAVMADVIAIAGGNGGYGECENWVRNADMFTESIATSDLNDFLGEAL